MEQIKKTENEPDFDQLNPEIVTLARSVGFIRQPLELFLDGKLTWMETLETMVTLLGKEYKAQNRILIDTLQERGPSSTLMLTGAGGTLFKALPTSPLDLDAQILSLTESLASSESPEKTADCPAGA